MDTISLRALFESFPQKYFPTNLPEIGVHGIGIDSRKIQPGDLFIARKGGTADGHNFINVAVKNGAAAVVGERELSGLEVPYFQVENSIAAVTWLAAAFHGHPGKRMTVIGVTGTDGKTTTCNLLYQILQAAGIKAGLISTVNAVIGRKVLDTGFHVTTPDAPEVQAYMAQMLAAGLTHVILETTSHGLAQHRTDACQYDIAVVTNVTHEHLDQHGSYENYLAVKARLMQLLAITEKKQTGNPRLAVLNLDDSSYGPLADVVHAQQCVRLLTYGKEHADLSAGKIQHTTSGLEMDILRDGKKYQVKTPLVGEFNVSNCLAAFSVAVDGLGIDPQTAAEGLAQMPGVPGRMERIDMGQPFTAIVDFAHTPNALRAALTTARQLTRGRVIAIFGSAGLRDREKRRLMAQVSAELADISILTAEDPRTESLSDILAEMAAGVLLKGGVEGKDFLRIADRGEAIRTGITMAKPGDVVITCGKGHEQTMCFGDVEYPWDDRTALQSALAILMDKPGPAMPHLPTQVSP